MGEPGSEPVSSPFEYQYQRIAACVACSAVTQSFGAIPGTCSSSVQSLCAIMVTTLHARASSCRRSSRRWCGFQYQRSVLRSEDLGASRKVFMRARKAPRLRVAGLRRLRAVGVAHCQDRDGAPHAGVGGRRMLMKTLRMSALGLEVTWLLSARRLRPGVAKSCSCAGNAMRAIELLPI